MIKRRPAPKAKRLGRPTGFARDDAIGAAMTLFWQKGYRAVSASDLADAMSIRRSSFYNSFGSREAVYREALSQYTAQSPDAPLDRVVRGQPVVPVLVSVFREICRVRAADKEARGCLVCNGAAELVGVDEETGPLVERAISNRAAAFAKLLRQAVDQREIAAETDVPATAQACVTFLVGLNTISKVVRSEKQLWASCRQFLTGIGVPKRALID